MKRQKKWFYGIYGMEFIWHNEWCDPEVIWHRHRFNYFDIEDPLWDYYREECEEKGMSADVDAFDGWVKAHAYLAREFCQNLIDAEKEAKRYAKDAG